MYESRIFLEKEEVKMYTLRKFPQNALQGHVFFPVRINGLDCNQYFASCWCLKQKRLCLIGNLPSINHCC